MLLYKHHHELLTNTRLAEYRKYMDLRCCMTPRSGIAVLLLLKERGQLRHTLDVRLL